MSYLSIRDADRVFRFLASTGRIELPRASWIETSGYLEHRAEMAVRALIRETEPKRDLRQVDKVWLQTWIHANAELIAREGTFPFLNAAKREIAQLGQLKTRGGLSAAPLPGGARQARPSRRLAHQPADLGFRAVRFRLALHLQQAGFLQGL